MKYLLDTNAVLYELKGISNPIDFRRSDLIYCSFITKIELLSYSELSYNDLSIIQSFLSVLKVIYIDDEIIQQSINIRKVSKLKLPDVIICATAFVLNSVLVTADKQLLNIAESMGIEIFNAL